MSRKNPKKLKSFLLPVELSEWIMEYARANNTTMTQIIIDYLMELRRKSDGYVDQV